MFDFGVINIIREQLLQIVLVVMGALNLVMTMGYAVITRHPLPLFEGSLLLAFMVLSVVLIREVELTKRKRLQKIKDAELALEASRQRFTLEAHQSEHERKRHLQIIESMIFLGETEKAEKYAESILSKINVS